MYLTEVSEELVSGVELVPPGVREDLRAIAAWLDKHNNTDRLTVYAKLRAEALSQSLKVWLIFLALKNKVLYCMFDMLSHGTKCMIK